MKSDEATSRTALRTLGGAMGVAIVSVLVFATQERDWQRFLNVASNGVLLSGGSTLIGATLGFLFGIPRTLQQGASDNGDEPPSPSVLVKGVNYRANTNLEQINKWIALNS